MNALIERWRVLAGDRADEVGRALAAAYSEPQRHYHGQSHLTWLLDEAASRASLISDYALVGFSIWFHDAVYQPGAVDNEERSADWARMALVERGAIAERVAALVLRTKNHAEGAASADEALFLDMDIAILGAPWEVYCSYAAGIRREFSAYNDSAYAAGRWRFLEKQLERARIFRTELYEAESGQAARANMRWELEEMRRGRMVWA